MPIPCASSTPYKLSVESTYPGQPHILTIDTDSSLLTLSIIVTDWLVADAQSTTGGRFTMNKGLYENALFGGNTELIPIFLIHEEVPAAKICLEAREIFSP